MVMFHLPLMGPSGTAVDNQGGGTVTFANTITGARATTGGAQNHSSY